MASSNTTLVFKLKRALVDYLLRPAFELAGSDHFSDVTLGGLGSKLYPYLDFEHGVFVELGAHDGLHISNTYYLERIRGWTGVLIEPIPRLYGRAVKNRPKCQVFNCACVAPDYPTDTITMIDANFNSIIKGSLPQHDAEKAYRQQQTGDTQETRIEIYEMQTLTEVTVPARMLTSVLDESGFKEIDFLSLDVEGHEPSVLRGLDFEKYRPKYMLIESFEKDGVNTRVEVDEIVLPYYESIAQLSAQDVLYKRK